MMACYDKSRANSVQGVVTMKKLGLYLLYAFSVFILSYNTSISPIGRSLMNYHFEEETPPFSSTIEKLIYLPHQSFNEKEALSMIENINRIDQNILDKAVHKGLKIKLFTGKLTEQSKLLPLHGKVPRGYSKADPSWDFVPGIGGGEIVYAKIGHSEFGKGHGSIALELHEFAHSLDKYVFQFVHYNPLFLTAWKEESKVLFPNQPYFHKFPEEYFAECFAFYYFDKESMELLKEKAPLTYQFMNQLIHNE